MPHLTPSLQKHFVSLYFYYKETICFCQYFLETFCFNCRKRNI
nr:MAG TPA_asm: hypothetical protein [Caudoviricetes sp.]